MKQLTGLDASFLFLETASQFGHVSSLSVFEPPDDPDYEPARRLADPDRAQRLHLLEPLRRRLRRCPFGLDHPYWIEDPDFDLDFHVRHTAVPPPGRRRQLGELVARIVGRPLDRSPPAVGELRHRGPGRRPLRDPHQGPPRHRRRRLGRRAAHDDARRRPGGRPDRPRRRRSGSPSRCPSDAECSRRRPAASSASRAGRCCSAPARSASWARPPATRCWWPRPTRCVASLRGPLGAVLNVGRHARRRGRGRRPAPDARRAPHAVQRPDHPAPPLRLPVGAASDWSRRSRTSSAPPSTTW